MEKVGMNITILANKLDLGRGGSNHSLDLLATWLERRGHDIRVVTFNFGGSNQVPSYKPYDVVQNPHSTSTRVGGATNVYQTIKKEGKRADLLHVFDPTVIPIAGWYKRRGGACAVVGRLNTYTMFCSNNDCMDSICHKKCTVRAKFSHDDDSLKNRITSLPKYTFDTAVAPSLASYVDQLFALSPAVRDVYKNIGVNPEVISIVPNFYDPSFCSDNEKDRYDQSTFSVLYVGRLHKKKGVDLLLNSLSWMSDSLDVHIVGDGPEKSKLEHQASNVGPQHNVTFHGWVPQKDLPSFYKSTDVFVHPGRWPEPFGRTILEAIQCNCPPIVSDIGAPPWIVQDNSFIFDVDEPESLAETLTKARFDSSRLNGYQAYLRNRLEEFSPQRVIDQIEGHYIDSTTS